MLQQLGQIAIETGVGLAAIQLALKTVNPAVAIAAGIALAALGSAIAGSIKNVGGNMGGMGGGNYGGFNVGAYGAQGGIPGLASGGIVTGPTLALIGEGRESEAVLPLSKLNSMLQNNSNGNGRLQVSGYNLYIANQRNQQRYNRVK